MLAVLPVILAFQVYPTIGGTIFVVVGVVAAMGYARTQAQKVWRESAEGWKIENEANKERADRIASELLQTASKLKEANLRTDITAVLGVLQNQHSESTALLTRIADESAERNGHISKVLAESNERVAKILAATDRQSHADHKESMAAIDKLSTEETLQKVAEKNP